MSLVRNGSISSMDQVVDKKRYDDNYEAIFGKRVLPNEKAYLERTASYKKDKMSVLDNPNGSINLMLKDKTMVRMIRDGKANDRGLKREAERIERENSTRPKIQFREKQQQKLQQAIVELRRSQR